MPYAGSIEQGGLFRDIAETQNWPYGTVQEHVVSSQGLGDGSEEAATPQEENYLVWSPGVRRRSLAKCVPTCPASLSRRVSKALLALYDTAISATFSTCECVRWLS